MSDDDLHPVVGGFVAMIAMAGGAFSLWCTYIAFAGGTLPLLGWKMEGSVGEGLVGLFIVSPIVSMVAYWIAMLIALPLGAIFRSSR